MSKCLYIYITKFQPLLTTFLPGSRYMSVSTAFFHVCAQGQSLLGPYKAVEVDVSRRVERRDGHRLRQLEQAPPDGRDERVVHVCIHEEDKRRVGQAIRRPDILVQKVQPGRALRRGGAAAP